MIQKTYLCNVAALGMQADTLTHEHQHQHKEYITMTIDLVKQYREKPFFESGHYPIRRLINKLRGAKNNTRFEKGNIIEFSSGYRHHIRYKAQVLGVDGDDIYLNWDGYWAPIQDDDRHKITMVQEV